MTAVTSPRVVSVNVMHALIPDRSGDLDLTGIDKRPVVGPVPVRTSGVAGDRQYDTRFHGGVDKAVYAYSREDAAWWAAELDRELPPGSFGENLSTEGLDVTGALVGERWRIGGAVLQVREPRIPCRTFQGFWDVPALVKRFTSHAAPGAYLAVVEEGEITAGDPIEVVHRPAHDLTLGELFRALTTEPALLPRVVGCDDVPAPLRGKARRRLSKVSA